MISFKKPVFENELISRWFLWLLWGISTLIVFKTFLIAMFDPDFWWHMAMGREMVEKHVFLRTEVFSHTMQGEPWVNFEWLFQVGLYLIYKLGGLGAVYWAKIVVCLAIVGALIKTLRETGLRGPWLLALTWLGFLVLRPRLFERAELITFFFLAVFVWVALRVRGQPIRSTRIFCVLIFGVMVVWTNSHGGFVYGLALLICSSIGSRMNNDQRPMVQVYDSLLVSGLLAILVNPFGFSIFSVHLEHLHQYSSGLKHIKEWVGLTLHTVPFYWFLLIVTCLSLLIALIKKIGGTLFWVPSLIVFSIWSSTAMRNTALVVFPAVSFLAEIIVASGKTGYFKSAAPILVTILFIGNELASVPLRFPTLNSFTRKTPFQALNFIRNNQITGKLYNSYEFGGYCDWFYGPGKNVFMDGRYIFLPLALEEVGLYENLGKSISTKGWDDFYKRYGIDHAVVAYSEIKIKFERGDAPKNISTLSVRFPRSEWALLYWDDAALVFVKRIPKYAALTKSREYRVSRPYSLDQMRHLLEAGHIQDLDLEKEIVRQREEAGPTRIGPRMELLLNDFKTAKRNSASVPKI